MEEAVRPPGSRAQAYLQLLRPANIITAWADILAGFAASGALQLMGLQIGERALVHLSWLLIATTGLYGGGVVLNDVFDADLDATERPERPIPSGQVQRRTGAILGCLLLLVGVVAAAMVSIFSAVLALAVAIWVVAYDSVGKHNPILGPVNMGLCRGGNLLLGVSAVVMMVGQLWFLAALPVIYIAAVTGVSRGEVHGGRSSTGWLAVVFIGLVILGLMALFFLPGFAAIRAVPFLLLFAVIVVPPYVRAAREPQPMRIRVAVRAGVLSLILLDATLAAGFGGWVFGVLTALLLPLSLGLARLFAVT
ncbi:MAG TPA: UbiA-like protein EboC [Rhodothermales bacterium]|nr:UbiA-like protein EboC [Rhodothermales bacterium]